MTEWNIQSRSHVCQGCQTPFADKQQYHTVLYAEKGLHERLDVCSKCWETQHSQGATDRKGYLSHWHAVYNVAPPAPPEAIQKDSAESLLRKLVERNDPRYSSVCYILAVMLERKRILKVKAQVQNDGKRVFVYEHPKSGDVFTIADADLKFDQLDEVQRDLDQLLEHGVPWEIKETPVPAPEAVASSEAPAEVPAAEPEPAASA